MKGSRLILISLFLVLAIGLAACAPGVVPTLSAVGGILQSQTSNAKVAAANPAPLASSPAQSVVAGDLQSALEKVYDQVNPSVVSIRVRVNAADQLQQMLPNMPDLPNLPNSPFRFFFGPNGQQSPQSPDSPGTPQQEPQTPQYGVAQGSGFVWDKSGHIVTNNHVVDGSDKIYVTFSDGTTLPATVVGHDPDSDLAVIKVEDASKVDLQPILVGDSTKAKVGQFVVAIGNPFGLENTMTFGIISAIGRSIPANGESSILGGSPSYTIPDVIQTDAPVNPGNSGGVLLDLDGNLLGVPSQIESPVRASAGVGFAIPAAIVKQVVPVLIETGKFEHAWIGISGGTLVPELATAMGLPATQRGALVSAVTSGSPAEKAGLIGSTKDAEIDGQQVKVGGDVIISIAGQPVNEFDDLVTYLAREGKVGDTVDLKVLRDGKETTVSLTFAARPVTQPKAAQAPEQKPQQQAPSTEPQQQAPAKVWLGIKGTTLTAGLAEAMDLSASQKGVLIQSVVSGSPADKSGLRGSSKSATVDGQEVLVGGDVITKANGENVEGMEQLVQLVGGQKAGDKLELTVLRDGAEVQVTATVAARPASAQ
jgi:serine protease Do